MSLHGSIKAFERAARTKHRASDHCSVLLMERPDLVPDDRTRISAFRDWVILHSICQFDADRSNRVARDVRDRAIPFLSQFGIDEPVVNWP